MIAPNLAGYIPENAISYCLQLWNDTPFSFRLSRSRRTLAGDFSTRDARKPRISINRDLPPLQFLTTLIHEVAHLRVYLQYKRRVHPHGKEWQAVYAQLMEPMLITDIYPEPLLTELKLHLQKPMASCYSDPHLMKIFRRIETPGSSELCLEHLAEGAIFKLQNRWYKKGKLLRKRFACRDIRTKTQYLIPAHMPIDEAQLDIFSNMD